jgi:hypothetical protein
MIDNKKIVDVAKQHSEESYISGYFQACYKDAFTDGAKWMQEEFLKNLWHSASKEPEKNHSVLFKTAGNSFGTEYIEKNDWATIVRCFEVVKWFYVDDLLPKEGGEK